MSRIRLLKVIYVLGGISYFALWTFRLLTVRAAERNSNPLALVVCLLVFAAPPALGYILLFKVLPWAAKRLRHLLNPA